MRTTAAWSKAGGEPSHAPEAARWAAINATMAEVPSDL